MDEISECGFEPANTVSRNGMLETDLDEVLPRQNGVIEESNLTEAISQSANSFATIKESLHSLLEKLKVNRVETPKKSLDNSEVVSCRLTENPKATPMDETKTKNRQRPYRHRLSSATSSHDSDSEDSGFHYDFRNRKYLIDQSGSSEDEISPTEECSIWDKKANFSHNFKSMDDHCHPWNYCNGECKNTVCLTNVRSSCSCDNLVRHQFRFCDAKEKYRAREVLTGKVEKGKKFGSKRDKICNSYVKIEIIPRHSRKPCCRTILVEKNNFPYFDQKFSFELLSKDEGKRVLISVWHRDLTRRNSEFLGCMSFGIDHVTKYPVCGWFRLMTDKLGKIKHFEVKSKGKLMSMLSKVLSKENGVDNAQEKENVSQNNGHLLVDAPSPNRTMVKNRPKKSAEPFGRKIRVKAQIEIWREWPTSRPTAKPMGVLKSAENKQGRENDGSRLPRIMESYELYMDTSIEEDYPELMGKTTHPNKYLTIGQIPFADENR